MIALLKYGTGMPFNHSAGLQRYLEIPLQASTQWNVIAAFAPSATPAYEALISYGAQGDVLHNDDTTVKILELMGKRAKQRPLDDDLADRTGLFTSGLVATRDGHRLGGDAPARSILECPVVVGSFFQKFPEFRPGLTAILQ